MKTIMPMESTAIDPPPIMVGDDNREASPKATWIIENGRGRAADRRAGRRSAPRFFLKM